MAAAPDTVAAVVLAAGASVRMGRPKALVPWRGRPLCRHAADLALAAGLHPTVVVWGAHPIAAELVPGAMLVENPSWPDGQLSSLKAGLRAVMDVREGEGGPLRGSSPGILVLAVDRPHVRPSTVDSLLAAHRRDPRAIWQPLYKGKRGHPILYPGKILPLVLRLPGLSSARDLFRDPVIAAMRRTVDTDDPAVLENLDTPDDLARLG
jgi:CTP:molybdopterin cytidylyltransferase MocA